MACESSSGKILLGRCCPDVVGGCINSLSIHVNELWQPGLTGQSFGDFLTKSRELLNAFTLDEIMQQVWSPNFYLGGSRGNHVRCWIRRDASNNPYYEFTIYAGTNSFEYTCANYQHDPPDCITLWHWIGQPTAMGDPTNPLRYLRYVNGKSRIILHPVKTATWPNNIGSVCVHKVGLTPGPFNDAWCGSFYDRSTEFVDISCTREFGTLDPSGYVSPFAGPMYFHDIEPMESPGYIDIQPNCDCINLAP